MSYVDKKDEEKQETGKPENVLKTLFADSTIVESPEDIIEKDTDIDRKNAFKRANDRLLVLCPDSRDKKKKKKKEKEKEEFDKNLNVRIRDQQIKATDVSRESKAKEDDLTKGIER